MMRFTFRKGLRFLESQCVWVLVRRLATGKLQFEDEQGEMLALSELALLQKWQKREWVIDDKSLNDSDNILYLATPRDLSTYSERDQKAARRRQAYLDKLADLLQNFCPEKIRPQIHVIANDIGDPNPPCPSSIYRWWKSYRSTKSVIKLVDGRHRSGRRRDNKSETFFENAISEVYLNAQSQIAPVYEHIQRSIAAENLRRAADEQMKCPSKATIYRRVAELDQYLVDQARLGKRTADRKYRPVFGKVKVSRILERVEVDHTPLDLIVIDEDTGLPLGRPWLTFIIDRYSRVILGFYICFHEPSSFSILQALKHAILPKEDWLAKYPDIKQKWPCYGIPELIASDNGMDLHADAYSDICHELGIQQLFCPSREPEYKGAIERLFRTNNQGLIHGLPGSVFSNTSQRGEYPSEELAAIDLKTLVHLLTKWIVEVYLVSQHRNLGISPLMKWEDGLKDRHIELPAYPEQLDVLVGIPATRTLFRYGVEVEHLYYNNHELKAILDKHGVDKKLRLKLKFYEDDISYIHVFDPYNEIYIRVDAIDKDYVQGLSRHVHRMIRENARHRFGENLDQIRLLEVKAEIQEIVAKAIRHKKMRNRKRAASLKQHDSVNLFSSEQSLSVEKQTVRRAKQKIPEMLDPGLEDELPTFATSERKIIQGTLQ